VDFEPYREPVRPGPDLPDQRVVGPARVPNEQPRAAPPVPVKIIVAGGFGVGKTTTVGAISEISPLTTEAEMTLESVGVDDPGPASGKTTTTIAMDFGCVTIDRTLKLYLFGTPGQARFAFMWDDLIRGALGALVVVDTNRIDDCYPAVDYFERTGLPFVVGVNTFNGQLGYHLDEVRWALAVRDDVPVISFDARFRGSVRDALLVVLDQALDKAIKLKSH
jgi:signal recognition particle receptor subunit beta